MTPFVAPPVLERLDAFLALLLQWNRTINLVGRADESSLRERHLADSLALLPLLPAQADRAVDLGSGGGFPGLVLAIASGRRFDLIESDQRKAAFLAEAAMRLQAPVRVIARRVEDAGVPPAALVTARALAPLPRLLRLAAPLLMAGGTALFPKGREADAELAAAQAEWRFEHEAIRVPGPEDGAVVLRVHNIALRRDAGHRASGQGRL